MIDIVKNHQKKLMVLFSVIVLTTAGGITLRYADLKQEDELILATTTSTYDSGLLDEIIPSFEDKHEVSVKVIAAGTGQAVQLGRRGDADVLLVHSPELEKEFIEDGYGKDRYEVMYNEFIIVGPKEDPAGLRGLNESATAFERLYENRSSITFCSRGDDSGTHIKEKELWKNAGFDYDSQIDDSDSKWYKSLGLGMGDTLLTANELMSDEKDVYTLTDEATYISMEEDLDELDISVRGDETLFNQYGIIPVTDARCPELSEDFAEWMISEEVQHMIDDYTVGGEKIFTANA